ncbi:Alpha/Beta hydrolase protein [Stachybotrys elegans]|uniref:Alpha/Beta hydrolase protein n=1 Tax=Stachybotrys elegans TaxID=80388 RepID=A0A8K0SHP0_9HYPO|nr:Alpha/Beta hydrolase protein [Stachybotrys elegans]
MEDSSARSIDPEVLAIRESVNRNTQWASDQIPWPAGMQETTHTATSLDGTKIEVRHLVPKVVSDQPPTACPNRAVVYVFGGGFVGGSVDIFRGFLGAFSELGETQLFAPAWRIAPENSWSDGVEDVYATVQWLQKNAKTFNVDPARILVAGQSAGATLAAGVTHLARDRLLSPPIAAQVLRYASLNDTSVLEPNSTREQFLSWTANQTEIVWMARMGGLNKTQRNIINTPPYAAPSRALLMKSLPPAHIGVGDYDIFRDENKLYADRLQAAGVAVEYFNYPESPHGFDGVPGSVQGRIMWDNEAAFVKKF